MRVVTFKVSETLLEELDTFSSRTGMSRSEIIRRALVSYLSRNGHPVPEDLAHIVSERKINGYGKIVYVTI